MSSFVKSPLIQLSPISFTPSSSDYIVPLDDYCRDLSEFDLSTLPHSTFTRWSDFESLRLDSKEIWQVYNLFLPLLTTYLNTFHKLNHDVHFWEQLVGPWLDLFICFSFSKYISLSNLRSLGITRYASINNLEQILPCDTLHFDDLIKTDHFNQTYAELLAQKMGLHPVRFKSSTTKFDSRPFSSSFNWILNSLKYIYFGVSNIFKEKTFDATFCGVRAPCSFYTHQKHLSLLQLYRGPRIQPPFRICNSRPAHHKLSLSGSTSEFSALMLELILDFIPLCFTYNFWNLRFCSKLIFPFTSKIIIDSTSFNTDELFKFWVATQRQLGAKYWIYQHGGGYETMYIYHGEILEKRISDRFLTWGHNSTSQRNYFIGVNPSERKWIPKSSRQQKFLLATLGFSRYTDSIYSAPSGSYQIKSYLANLKLFASQLDLSACNSFTVRIHPSFITDVEVNFWKSNHLRVSDYHLSFVDELNESSLFVCTYNATTMIQSYLLNIPTIALWSQNNELRPKARSIFHQLYLSKMLFNDPILAASHINLIANDPVSWWNRQPVQTARMLFLKHFGQAQSLDKNFYNLLSTELNI